MQSNSGYKTDELNINICYLYDIVTTSKKDYIRRPIKFIDSMGWNSCART